MATTENDQAGTDGRWVEYVPVDELVPDPRNPKAHSADDLRASLGRFGYAELITVDERTGRIVSGHGRRELLLDDCAAGREPPEGVRVGEDGRWLVPVVRGWLSADDDEAWAYLVAANRIGEVGGWHTDLLAEGLERLSQLDRALLGTGYNDQGLRDVLALAGTTGEREAAFLADLAQQPEGGRRAMGGDEPVPYEDASQLTLTFASRVARDEAARFLRGYAADHGLVGMAEAVMAVARERAESAA